MKKYISLFLCCAALWLYACGSPEQSEEIPAPVGDTGAARTVNVEFTTDDGLIKISIHDDNADSIPAAMPVLRVRPKIITSDMARQMAKGLFGEAELYEYSEELSKAEIADMIAAYEYAVTDESIKAAQLDRERARCAARDIGILPQRLCQCTGGGHAESLRMEVLSNGALRRARL